MKTESRVRILVLVFVVLMAGRFGPGLVRSGASYLANLWLHIIDPTRYWVQRLERDKSDEGQREAVRALVKIGPPAVPHLIASLRRLGGASTQIVMCLGQLGSPAVPALMEAVGDPNPEMQSDAVRALGLMGHSAHPAISLLIKMLKDASPGDHSAVSRLTMDLIDTLGKIGPEVIAPATDALLLADDAHRWLFAAVLGRSVSGAEFTPQLQAVVAELRNALEHDEDSVRISAAFGLSALGRTASSAIPDLIRALKDPNHDVRRNACVALGRMGSEVAAAVPSLIGTINDEVDLVRREAAFALVWIGLEVKPAVPVLIEQLNSQDPQLLYRVCEALGKIGPDAESAVMPLTKMLKNRDFNVRTIAVITLGKMGPEARAAVPALIDVLEGKEPPMRLQAARALGQIGPDADAALPALRKLLHDKPLHQQDAELQSATAEAMKSIDPDSVLKPRKD